MVDRELFVFDIGKNVSIFLVIFGGLLWFLFMYLFVIGVFVFKDI